MNGKRSPRLQASNKGAATDVAANGVPVAMWLSEPLDKAVRTSIARLQAADDVRRIAVMPDVHLAEDVCVGVVLATSELIYPAAIGGDIGCGMAAVRLHADAELLQAESRAAALLDGLYQRVPGNRQRAETAVQVLPAALNSVPLSCPRLDKQKSRDGRVQFGTLGRGNHFLEFQADEQDGLWVMLHSGSRAMGQLITKHHLNHAEVGAHGLRFLRADQPAGRAYLDDSDWAVAYAQENRLAMLKLVAQLLSERFGIATDWTSLVNTSHNHVRREPHYGETMWVHRKGAQSAAEGEVGLIPGSMGTPSYHVTGRGCVAALQSSSHGAGRVMSRHAARQAVHVKQLRQEMNDVWFDTRRSRQLCDEAPSVYKNIARVLKAQKKLVRVTRMLRPLLSYKG